MNQLSVGWERCAWDAVGQPMSRRERAEARGSYLASIPPDIAGLQFDIPSDVAAAAEDALIEISRFDAELAASLPAADGELAPLAVVLLRTESASSSQIEGVTAGAKALAIATLNESAGQNARLVAANVEAMQKAIGLADDLSVGSILAAHRALMHDQSYARPGMVRDGQVWIGGGPTPHTATFVPPRHERVPALLEDLVAFCRRTDIPVLTQLSIAHAQFETIHPFNDGNGRTGRTLVHAMLRRSGVTRRLTVPVSAGLLTDTDAYFAALGSYRDGDPTPIITQFSRASFAAVGNGRRLVSDLTGIYASWQDTVPSRKGSAARRLLPLLLSQPAVTVAYVRQHLAVSQPAAQRAIDQLVDVQVLKQISTGRRDRAWIARDVITALDDFAARTGRRT
ncbi:Fic family protein [Kribbella sp.]|uniref:Fic family protein n=1 Tax=Kribbella sp. TaxID=1871183 RepID=UPI002D4D5B0C|nr:Fic family protein [Kribbella sp.]HZX02579.1 Fic family protein [Kribbella sp.]